MNINIFTKMLFIFLIPALGMIYFTGTFVQDKLSILDRMALEENSIKYLRVSEELLHSLQKERGFSSAFISSSSKEFKSELDKQREASNQVLENYKKQVLNLGIENAKLQNQIKTLQVSLFSISDIRRDVDNFNLTEDENIKRYTQINDHIISGISILLSNKFSQNTYNDISSLITLMRVKDLAGIERALLTSVFLNKKILDEEHFRYIKTIIKEQAKITKEFINQTTLENTSLFYEKSNSDIVAKLKNYRTIVLNEAKEKIAKVDPKEFWRDSTLSVDSYGEIIDEITLKMINNANEAVSGAKNSLLVSLLIWVIGMIGLGISIILLKKIITMQKDNYKNLTKQKQLYNVLTQTNELIIHDYEMDEVFQNVCNIVVNEVDLSLAFIGVINSENDIDIAASTGKQQLQDYLQKLDLSVKHDKAHNLGLAGKAIIEARNIIIDNITEDKTSLLLDIANEYELNSAGAFPLVQSNTIIGVLVVYSKDINFFDADVTGLFERMSGYLSFGLDKEVQNRLNKLYEEEIRISAYAFDSQEAMVITDKEANIIKINNAFTAMTGYTKAESIGKNPRFLKSNKHESKFFKKMWKDLDTQDRWSGEVYNRRKNGEIYPQKTTITAIKNKYNKTTHYIGQFYDMSDIKQSEEKLTYQARHDALTGLPNRIVLKDRLTQAIKSSKRHKTIGALMFIDLDNFKNINDSLGHDIGDELLKQIANILTSSVREEDSVIRFGGDEFLILATNLSEDFEEAKQKATTIANKIREKIDVPLFIKEHKLTTTPSIGITFFPPNSVDTNEIIKQADIAMYKAKDAGKNSIQYYIPTED